MLLRRYYSFILLLALCLATACAARPPAAKWERLHVTRVLPSQVFARLGLSHITRRGYTRDGAKKGDPDPTFPPGLTDVVPYDAERVLLVRGTAAGVTAFKVRVAEAEDQLTAARWHVQAELLQSPGIAALGPAWQGDIPSDQFVPFTLSDPPRDYRVRVHVAPAGAVTAQWQSGLRLAPAAPGMAAPPMVWSAVQTRPIIVPLPAVFDDLAADRATARTALALPPDVTAGDYQVRITITPLAVMTPPAAPAAPAVPVVPALPLPPPPSASTGTQE